MDQEQGLVGEVVERVDAAEGLRGLAQCDDRPGRRVAEGDAVPVDVVEPGVGRGGSGVEPVAGALEGVGGQVDPPCAGGEPGPVDVPARHVQPGQCLQQRGLLVAVVALRRNAAFDQRGQRGVGSDLQYVGGVEPGRTVGEPHGPAHVAEPVLRIRGGRVTGDADEVDLRGGQRHRVDQGAELRQDLVHVGGVEGMADLEPGRLEPPLLRRGQHGEDRVLVTGDHSGSRAVDGGDLHALGEFDLLGCGADGRHRTPRGDRAHQRAALHDQPRGVLQRQDSGHVGGRDLPHGVSDHDVGRHAPRREQPDQRDLEGEERGLGVLGLGDPVLLARQLGTHVLRVQREHGIPRPRENGMRGRQAPAHAGALRTLAGEDERGASPRGRAAEDSGAAESGEAGRQLGTVADDDRTVRQAGSGGGQGVRHVGGGEVGQVRAEPRGLFGEGGLVLRRQDPGVRAGGLRRGGRDVGGLLQDDVSVGAADAERRHARTAGPVEGGPVAVGGQQLDGAFGPVDARVRSVDVQRGGQQAVPHGLHRLDHPGDACRGLGVPEVRLHRAEVERLVPVLAVGHHQGLRLDRVTEDGAGAVCLDEVDVGGVEPGRGERGADHPLLRRAVGGGEAVGGAVRVDRGPADDGEDLVAVAAGVGEAFQQHQPRALAETGAIGPLGERAAATVGRQPLLAGELDEHAGGGHDGDPTREGEVALPRPQRLRGQVHGDQRRRARRVDGDRGPLQPERVGDPAGHDAGGVTGAQVAFDALGNGDEPGRVVLVHHAREHTGPAAAQSVGVHPRPLEGLPRDLQQLPLLRVHRQCLSGRDAEQARVEVGGSGEEAARRAVGAASAERGDVPAPVGGERPGDVPVVHDEVPQVLG